MAGCILVKICVVMFSKVRYTRANGVFVQSIESCYGFLLQLLQILPQLRQLLMGEFA